MISRLLLHFDGVHSANEAISSGVQIAARAEARIRGLKLLDIRRLTALAVSCEAAGGCTSELERLAQVDVGQESVCSQLEAACERAGVALDIRHMKGDPVALLPAESQFYDMIITSLPSPEDGYDGGLSPRDVLTLVENGVQPLLVLRPRHEVRRVLLVSDGSQASAASIRQFLLQRPFPAAELRLLAIGESESQSRTLLEMLVEYGRQQGLTFETGWLQGTVRRSLIPYAQKWQTDLVVTGIARQNVLFRPLLQHPVEQLLRKTNIGLYAMG